MLGEASVSQTESSRGGRPPRHLFTLFRLLLSAALIWFIARKLDWNATVPLLKRVNVFWASAASSLSIALIILLAIRWSFFLRAFGFHLGLRELVRLTWAGQFFNSYLPGSIGGDAIKMFAVIGRFPERRLLSSSTIILDRLSALLALFILAGVSLTIDPFPLSFLRNDGRWTHQRGVVLGVGIVVLIGVAGCFLAGRVLRTKATRLRDKLRPLLAIGGAKARICVLAIGLGTGIHLLNFLIVYLFARSLGLTITYLQMATMMAVVLAALLVPVTINGHGLREYLFVQYFTHWGIHSPGHAGVIETAVAFSLVLVANDLLCGLPGGLLYMLRARRPQERPAEVEAVEA
jgi:uncharacterized membrane protein YbhN (UPF0104 family)